MSHNLRIGCPCYPTDQGIGILAKSFYDHGIITDPLIMPHRKHVNHFDWYPANTPRFQAGQVSEWLHSLDVLFCIETPFYWEMIPYCKEHGIRTVIVPMYECFQTIHLNNQQYWPDSFICASDLDFKYFDIFNVDSKKSPVIQRLNFPVSVPWRKRIRAEVFIHNAGHGGLLGRNGTQELIEAMQYVKSPAKLLLRAQDHLVCGDEFLDPKNISTQFGTIHYSNLFTEGDVFILPDKFAGQSCPLEEARASGMLVITSDRFPHNTWLPTEVTTVCNACDGEGSLMFQWAKEHMVKTGGKKVYLTGDRASEGFYYVTGEGKEIGMKTIGGPCGVCQGSKVQNLSPLIPVASARRNRIGHSYLEFDEAIIDPRDIAATIDKWYGADITAYSLSGQQFARERSWEVLGPQWLKAITDRQTNEKEFNHE